MIRLEHANVTVSDPDATAAWLGEVFGWTVRWSGPAMQTGRSVHVGTSEGYVALFSPGETTPTSEDSYRTAGMLNHLAVFTDEDIDAVEARVRKAGFTPGTQYDYAPGRRFYFDDHDGIEWEVASHQT
ncbi:VOC family protein [Pseudooceanicola sp.]|uniref:VOC family protein n=1 Tax=Pseudooceanicola sp. TaxID=1914328 RepID=UPI0035C6898B